MAIIKVEPEVVVKIALSQVGYHEKASNSQLDDNTANSGSGNFTKYARDLDALGNFYNGQKNGYAWCDVFVDWCFVQAYGVDKGMELLCQPTYSAGAGCSYSANYYRAKGQFYTSNPKIGDQIFFYSGGGINHTGIVVAIEGLKITTVEGNSSDKVSKNEYSITSTSIAGYGRPNYDSSTVEVDTDVDTSNIVLSSNTNSNSSSVSSITTYTSVRLPVLRYGQANTSVKRMQALLINAGFSVGVDGADGDYGNNTKTGLINFQKANNLVQSGICDSSTWAKLICG